MWTWIFPTILRAERLRMMVKLTMHWIMFPFGLRVIFLPPPPPDPRRPPPPAREVLIVISWQSISNDPPAVYVMFCWGKSWVVIFIKGGMAQFAQLPHVSTVLEFNHFFPGKTSGLGADKHVCRQNIVITVFHYNETVSLSHKTNRVHLKRYNISCNTPSGGDSRPPFSWQRVTGEFQTKGQHTVVLRSILLY